jgi:SAM-dependent methyltransferase
MRPSQDQLFAAREGDKWFERNKAALERFDPDTDLPIKAMDLYHLRPCSILEVGAANGFRLAAISERHDSRMVAVEPSIEAILDGKSKFPRIKFVQGEASAIPLQELFDLIIVNFVFHWIDRINLLRSIAEIDRLLADGGFLIIGDFLPSNLTRVRYHHLAGEEVHTYKQNYGAVFLASGLYHPVGLIAGNHSAKTLSADVAEEERIGVWLLRKKLTEHYVEGMFIPDGGR